MDKQKLFKFCFGCDPSFFTETAVITPVFPLRRFKEYGEAVKDFKGRVYSGAVLKRGNGNVTVIHCGVGDRLTGDAVLLLENTPVRNLIFAGSCGGLKDCRIGDIVLCEKAFNGEGFSRYWAKDFEMEKVLDSGSLIPADEEFTERARAFSSKAGDIFTIGSLVAEEKGDVGKIEKKGFIGIDLELSAVYKAARVIGRKAAGLLFVSDLPLKKPLGEDFTAEEKEAYRKGLEKVIGSVMEFA
jgi:purine-nucleoside phosphorylase